MKANRHSLTSSFLKIGLGRKVKDKLLNWLLNFNTVKTFVIHLGNTNLCHTYMDGQPLQVVSEHKDLEIIVDSFNTLNRKTVPIPIRLS